MIPLAKERNEIELNSPNGVTAGGVATFKIPQGYRLHKLRLELGGGLADYEEIRVKANTTTIHRYTATERDMMNQTDKIPSFATLGYLMIPFDTMGMRNREAEEETALNIGRPNGLQAQPNEITSAEVQVKIAAGAVSPSIKIYAVVSNAIPGGAGLVRHIVKTSRDASGAGEVDFHDFEYGTADRMFIRRAFFNTTALENIKIKRDNDIIFERSKAVNDGAIKERDYRVQQAGWTLVDKGEDGYGGHRINTVGAQSMRWTLDFTGAAPNFTVLMEYLGTLAA